MKWQRSLGILVVFLLLSGSVLGSEPEKRLQVQWAKLEKLVGGRGVVLQLVEGAWVEGRVRKVTDDALVVKVKRSSHPAAYLKGKMQIPRAAVTLIEARNPKIVRVGREARRMGLTVGAFVGTLVGSLVIVFVSSNPEGSLPGEIYAAAVGISAGVAVLTYRAIAPKKGITRIEILPDSPGERGPKPTGKAPGASPTASGETPALSPVEAPGPGQLRLQARQALMRKGRPLDLSSLPGSRAREHP